MLHSDAGIKRIQEQHPGCVDLIPMKIGVKKYSTLALFENLCRTEYLLRRIIGSFKYRSKTVVFDAHSSRGKNPGKKLRQEFKLLHDAHSWFCHRTARDPDFTGIHAAMNKITVCVLESANELFDPSGNSLISPHAIDDAAIASHDMVSINIEVTFSASRMKIPMARVPNVVGRTQFIKEIVAALAAEDAAPRILIHGMPGVGKDVVATEVVHHPRIQYCRHYFCGHGYLL